MAQYTPTVVQEQHYYPWGLDISPLEKNAGDEQFPFFFNSKEKLTAFDLEYLDYGARIYDLQLSRWSNDDPAYQFASPYDFCGGDPVNRIDPDGRFVGTIIGAAVGFTVGFINGGIDNAWRTATAGALAGLAADLIIVSAGTASPIVVGIAAGAISGAVGYTAESALTGKTITAQGMGLSILTGAAAGVAGHYLGVGFKSLFPKTFDRLARFSGKFYSPLQKFVIGVKNRSSLLISKLKLWHKPTLKTDLPKGNGGQINLASKGPEAGAGSPTDGVLSAEDEFLIATSPVEVSKPSVGQGFYGEVTTGQMVSSTRYQGPTTSKWNRGLPYEDLELAPTIEKIKLKMQGIEPELPYSEHVDPFKNKESFLPQNNYKEIYVHFNGSNKYHETVRFVLSEDGLLYFTPNHYQSFFPIPLK